MQLFALSHRLPELDAGRLEGALVEVAGAFPGLDPGTRWSTRSASGAVALAALRPADSALAAREYHAREGDVLVLIDGLPVARDGSFSAHRASALLPRWEDAACGGLDGQYSAVRVDLASDVVEGLTDTLGLAPLYCLRRGEGVVLSNCAEAIRLVAGARAPDPMGVSTALALGWAAAGHTLLAEVRTLAGGHRYRLARGALVAEPYFALGDAAGRRPASEPDASRRLASELVGLVRAAALPGAPMRCALTAGHDSRLLLALLRAAEVDAAYYTMGSPADADVQIASLLADRLDLAHEVWQAGEGWDGADPAVLLGRFVTQTDGRSSLLQVRDYVDQLDPQGPLGVKSWGAGGEIGRGGAGILGAFAANAPLLRAAMPFQHRVLQRRITSLGGLAKREAVETAITFVRGVAAELRARGWAPRELTEAFYAFERMPGWASAGVRRTSGTDDAFTPFISQAFISYAFSLSPAERAAEAPHHRILSVLDPVVRDLPLEEPWRSQRRRVARLHATLAPAGVAAARARRALPRWRGGGPAGGLRDAALGWLEPALELHREVCLSASDSPLWNWVERSALERLLGAEPGERAARHIDLLQVLTLFWYFHGPQAAQPG